MFLFTVRIPALYAKSRSLYADFFMFLSKQSSFYSDFILLVCTLDISPVHPWGGGGGIAQN